MRTLFAILLTFTFFTAAGQSGDSLLTDHFLLNFAVPDMPASKALGTDPSNLLTPSDIQKFAASFQPFYTGGQGVIPRNFALEFAPWKLASRKWNLGIYNKGINSLLYNSAFSVATVRDTTTYASKLSIGYHLTIGSKNSDILKKAYKTDWSKALFKIQTNMFAWLDEIREDWGIYVIKIPRGAPDDSVINYTNNHVTEFFDYLQDCWATPIKDSLQELHYKNFLTAFNLHSKADLAAFITSAKEKDPAKIIANKIDSVVSRWNDSMWNAGRWDIAIAWTAASKDTLIKNAQFSAFNLWVTKACQISNWGQLLLGGSLTLPRTEKNDTVTTNTNFTLNARLYAGTNSIKGFVETQYQYQNFGALKKSLLFNLGGEFRIGQQFWAVASAGINNYLGISNPFGVLVSSLGIRYGFNKPK